MRTIIEFIQMLHAILELQHSKRAKLIKQFQEEVWYDEATQDEKLNEILSEIADLISSVNLSSP